jgi:uncharacterized protein YbjT (DUF2867 family)
MAKVLLLGASGLVGGALLTLLQQDSRVDAIIAPTRRPLAASQQVENPRGEDLLAVVSALPLMPEIVFCCLGTTRKQAGSAEAFRAVDYQLITACASVALARGARHCLVVSARNANAHSPWLYYRTKGETEQALMAQGWPQLTLVRPSLLLGERTPVRLAEKWSAPLLRRLPGNLRAIAAGSVAKALLALAFCSSQSGLLVLESAQLETLAAEQAQHG